MRVTIRKVENEHQYAIWYSIYSTIFSDSEDIFPKDYIWNWFQRKSETTQVLLIVEYQTKPVGFIWQMVNTYTRHCYYYYFGVIDIYRKLGIFSWANELNEQYLISKGIDILIAEPKNPNYCDDDEEKIEALSRIIYYINNIKFYVVSDIEISYLRHYPPDRLWSIQNCYLIGFKPLSKTIDKRMLFKGKLRKKEYKNLYLNVARMELGINTELELRTKSIAAECFLRNLDSSVNDYFTLIK